MAEAGVLVGVEEGGVVVPVVAGEDVAAVVVAAAFVVELFGEAAFAAVAFVGSVGQASVEVFVEVAVPKMHQHQDEIDLGAMLQRLRSLEAVVWAVARIGHVPVQESGEIAGNFGRP